MQIQKWTTNTLQGAAPNLNTIYEIGTMKSNTPPTID